MYKRILVPVDGSATARCGLREAIRLAKDQAAVLRLVHVVDEFLLDSAYLPTIDYDAYCKARREAGQRTLAQMQAITREEGIEVEGLLLETIGGRAADLIVDAARQWPADLIVMGTHGRRGVRRLLMGSDAAVVLHSATVPVLMVREPGEAQRTSQ
jgi:nucleotide-binding universal stress UspA family protein